MSVNVDMKMPVIKIVNAGLLLCLLSIGLLIMTVPAKAASVGELAPDFEITTQDGKDFRLSEFRGRKPVYVVFWNTWCSYCITKTPRYEKLQEQFGDQIEIIAINTTWSDSPEDMQSFEAQHKVSYKTAFDAGEQITDRYRVLNVPTEFIVDLDGVIRYRDGVPKYLAAHLPDWLSPYVPSKTTTSLSCSP